MDKNIIYTVGHSNYTFETFLKIVTSYGIQYIVDVRSYPYSNYCPHFNREELKELLKQNGVSYLFMGDNLGARPKDRNCYISGKVDFEILKETESFKAGIFRLKDALNRKLALALMCSEKEPINCHRAILISRVLKEEGCEVLHILDADSTCSQQEIETELQKKFHLEPLLFDTENSAEDRTIEAYKMQEEKITYSDSKEREKVESRY